MKRHVLKNIDNALLTENDCQIATDLFSPVTHTNRHFENLAEFMARVGINIHFAVTYDQKRCVIELETMTFAKYVHVHDINVNPCPAELIKCHTYF